jgi:hypothetical protein
MHYLMDSVGPNIKSGLRKQEYFASSSKHSLANKYETIRSRLGSLANCLEDSPSVKPIQKPVKEGQFIRLREIFKPKQYADESRGKEPVLTKAAGNERAEPISKDTSAFGLPAGKGSSQLDEGRFVPPQIDQEEDRVLTETDKEIEVALLLCESVAKSLTELHTLFNRDFDKLNRILDQLFDLNNDRGPRTILKAIVPSPFDSNRHLWPVETLSPIGLMKFLNLNHGMWECKIATSK